MTQDYRAKNTRACSLEDNYLPYLYNRIARQWELARGSGLLALSLQKKIHIDAVLLSGTGTKERLYFVEHKFIFYHGNKPGKNVTIETLQNSYSDTPGWSITTQADFILFAFEHTPEEKILEVYLVPWRKLKVWFSEHGSLYRLYTDHKAPNAPEMRIIPISHIERAITGTRRYIISENGLVVTDIQTSNKPTTGTIHTHIAVCSGVA